MPHVTETFVPARSAREGERPPRSHVPSRAVLDVLHEELAAVGMPIDTEEARGFGPATAERLTHFQKRYRLPVTGDLDPTTGGVLSLAALVASETDRVRLRTRLAEARGAVAGSETYDKWLARFSVMAGAYDVAASIGHLGGLGDFGIDLGGIVFGGSSTPVPRAPEIPFPENFYSYRYPLISQADIDALRTGRTQGMSARVVFALSDGATQPSPEGEPPPFDPPLPPAPPTPQPPSVNRADRLANAADAWLRAIEAWQIGNRELLGRRYAAAVAAYDRCQRAAIEYFAGFPDYNMREFNAPTLAGRIDQLTQGLVMRKAEWPGLWEAIAWRRQLLSLAELGEHDWFDASGSPRIRPGHLVYAMLRGNLGGNDAPDPPAAVTRDHRVLLMDLPLVIIATVLAPLARGEANRQRRQYAAARADFTDLLSRSVWEQRWNRPPLLCEFIEVPFVRLQLIETLIEQGEAEYKARAIVDDITDDTRRQAALATLDAMRHDFENRQLIGSASAGAKPFQHLVAALTYGEALQAIAPDGTYLVHTQQAVDAASAMIATTSASGGPGAVAAAAQAITIPTVGISERATPTGAHPHEPLVRFVPPDQQPMRECNPRVYGLLLQAHARLLQIWCGFNYLGYRDDYLPPWRFGFLLDRARYFVEHAKNAQRDYLNFLSNAENEELKELSAAQNVELEKVNVAVETARKDQASREHDAAKASKELADLTAKDAQARLDKFESFEGWMLVADIAEAVASAGVAAATAGTDGGGPGGFADTAHSAAGIFEGYVQRDREKQNLVMARDEAQKAAAVAGIQVDVARMGVVVANLQRQAALLRHAHAVQTLQFMRNRTLNSEQWYRLAAAIRDVADTYLRYAIELSFLAQQAYNFETDQRLSVIRFDYDLSDIGAMLAADFLLRDLDTLEQDLVVRNTQRLEPVRLVVSLARDHPEALGELRERGSVTFSVLIEELERRFPGLLGLRISSVELQPIALMDPTRVSVQLTHLGFGMTRLRRQPGGSPLDESDPTATQDWLGAAGEDWPIKLFVSGPESAVFTGLSRQDISTASPITVNQRGAFEGLPAAASWDIDMSMYENRVVPGTLADVLLTFVLIGNFDDELKRAVSSAMNGGRPLPTMRLFSARSSFPDAYHALVRYGRTSFPISHRDLSTASRPAGKLRNVGIALRLAEDGPELGRWYCRYTILLDVAPGTAAVRMPLPALELTPNGLSLRCRYVATAPPLAGEVSWEFGDGSPSESGADVTHAYALAGQYEVTARLVHDDQLVEYRGAVVISDQHSLESPLIATPLISAGPSSVDGLVPVTFALPPETSGISIECTVDGVPQFSATGSITLALAPRAHVVRFTATRKLSARFYGKQRYLADSPVVLERGRIATNRTFDADGNDTTVTPSTFGAHVFGMRVLSPADRWTLEIPADENPWFATVSLSDVVEMDYSELADAVLALEYEQAE